MNAMMRRWAGRDVARGSENLKIMTKIALKLKIAKKISKNRLRNSLAPVRSSPANRKSFPITFHVIIIENYKYQSRNLNNYPKNERKVVPLDQAAQCDGFLRGKVRKSLENTENLMEVAKRRMETKKKIVSNHEVIVWFQFCSNLNKSSLI